MFNNMTNLLTIFIVLAFTSVIQASPLYSRDVIAPKIITPNANTVWTVGSVETVTWDTSNFPPDSQITNPIGKVILGYAENNSLNLDIDHPLASGFKLRDGSVQITVPDVKPRNDYIIVLYGDSGNTSPAFTITKITNPSSSSSSSSSISTDVTPSQTVLQPSSSWPPSWPSSSSSSTTEVPLSTPESQDSLTATSTSSGSSSSTTSTSSPADSATAVSVKSSQAWSKLGKDNAKVLMALTTFMTVTVLLLV